MSIVMAAMLGWTGTIIWWFGPRGPYGPNSPLKPQPQPWRPEPDPWRIFGGILGAIGGVVATTVFRAELAGAGLLAAGATALLGGLFVADLVINVAGLGGRRA